jgi:hypothetical protein
MALTQARGGAVLNPEDLGPSFIVQTVDANMKPFSYIADGWGEPLVFLRFPTDHPDLNPGAGTPQAGLKDTLDSEGLLANPAWLTSSNQATFESLLHRLPDSGVQSYNLMPLIVSAGPNGNTGFGPLPPDVFNLLIARTYDNGHVVDVGAASDNIASFSLLALHARGQ